MRKIKKVFSTSVILTSLSFIPIVLVNSCGFNKEFYSNNDIGGLTDWLGQTKDRVEAKAKEIRAKESGNINVGTENEMSIEQAKKLLNQKTILISTGGKVNDNSFNQLVWETVSSFSKSIGNNKNRYYETQAIDQNMQNDAYNYAINNGFKIWILTGFQQETLLGNWLKIGKNKERFDKAGIKIITVDWYSNSLTQPGRLLGLNFKTQESSFVVGYSASKLVSEIYPGIDDKSIKNRYFNTFAGGDFSGATNFNYGFYEGLRKWNSEQIDNSTKVASTTVSKNVSVDLNTSFAITNDSRAKVNNAIDGYSSQNAPKVSMPVAGSLTSIALDRVQEKKSEQWIVGVDTDMAKSFNTMKDLILTSSEKKISIALYKALSTFYGLSEELDGNKINDIRMVWDNENYLIQQKQQNRNINDNLSLVSNYNFVGGYSEDFVSVSKSTLNPNLKFAADHKIESLRNKTYAQRFDEIVVETWNKFFGEDKKSGEFEKNKPSELEIYNGPIFFNNPKYGGMTANNLDNYFNLAIFGGTAKFYVYELDKDGTIKLDEQGKPILKNEEERTIVGINSWLSSLTSEIN